MLRDGCLLLLRARIKKMEKVYNEPNETTIAAMKEAKEGKNLETLDLAKFKEFIASL